jgi:hypothetical protein
MISVSGQDRPPNGTSAQLTRGRLILFDITERVENTLVSLSKEASWNLKLIHQCSEPHHTIPFQFIRGCKSPQLSVPGLSWVHIHIPQS